MFGDKAGLAGVELARVSGTSGIPGSVSYRTCGTDPLSAPAPSSSNGLPPWPVPEPVEAATGNISLTVHRHVHFRPLSDTLRVDLIQPNRSGGILNDRGPHDLDLEINTWEERTASGK